MTLENILELPQRIFRPQIANTIDIGDLVAWTDGHGRANTGYVKLIGISPYYLEEQRGFIRAYVVVTESSGGTIGFPAIADWCTAEQLAVVTKSYVEVWE